MRSVLWQCPNDAVAALVLAHGAGAGMRHASMQAIADAFERRGIATLRFDFPYMAAGRSRVDSPAVATQAIADGYAAAAERTKLPIWLGGHSFGGRMATHAVVDRNVPAAGLILCSFPLHMPGKPDTKRAQHLARDSPADAVPLRERATSSPSARCSSRWSSRYQARRCTGSIRPITAIAC